MGIKKRHREGGFTLIEIMISLGLLSLVMVSLMTMLMDYERMFNQARQRNVFIMLRRRVMQNIINPASWKTTYEATINTTDKPDGIGMKCLWDIYTVTPLVCPTTAQFFTVFGPMPPLPNPQLPKVILRDQTIVTYGFSDKIGEATNTVLESVRAPGECDTYNNDDPDANPLNKTPAALRCPIRLEVTWQLLNSAGAGISKTFPMGYFPEGYYSSSYWRGSPAPAATFWWFGTLGAQVLVKGTFKVNRNVPAAKFNTHNYDFQIIKDVP